MHEVLMRDCGTKAYTYKSVVYHARQAARRASEKVENRRGRGRHNWLDSDIQEVRDQIPGISARGIAKELEAPRETVRQHIIDLGGKFGPAARVPHVLNPSQKRIRVECARELLQHLNDKKKWPSTLTGDESWMYLSNEQAKGWTFPGDDQLIRVDRQQADPKRLFVVFFSTVGFKVAEFLPEGATVNAVYMENLFRSIGVTSLRPLWIHMDNAAPHRAKRTQNALQVIGISSLRHPPYSPDLAPSDFWLFGRIKQALGCSHFSNEAELKGAILDIIHKITTPEIRRVYNEWMRRLQACIDSEGEYVHLSQ